MKTELRSFGTIALAALIGLSMVTALAQQKQAVDKGTVERTIVVQGPDGSTVQHPADDRVMIERHAMQGPEGPPPPPGAPVDFVFLATEMSFGGKLVKGSPYSAQAVTESTQTLSDGNRIVNKSTAAIYRDSEGRTRREQTIKAIGPFANSGESRQTIFISDPVAGTSYTLDPTDRIARKMPPLRFKFEGKPAPPPEGKAGVPKERMEYRIEMQPDVMIRKGAAEAGVSMGWVGAHKGDAKSESLGKQNIEGVEAEGTRTTITIPAGQIGNERDIEIVSERWYSPELQTIVMTRHSDPRFGDNTYRLTNISREEPARFLFEVPADYTVKEGPTMAPEPMRMRHPAPPPEQ